MNRSLTTDEPTRQLDADDVLPGGGNDALYQPEILESEELPPGTHVGRYWVSGRLGAGGMGIVYEAWDPQLERSVALKVLRTSRPHASGHSSDDLLLAEAQTLARITHPNIVTVYDAGATAERVFLAMELCRGENLRQWLEHGTRSVREILDVFIAAGRGLAAAHQAGVIHRDFKLANVLIGKDGSVRVADFGMARFVALAIDIGDGSTTSASDRDHSVSTIVGTPTYMAPEQLLGRLGDHRMDQFSFCLSLYWALLGHPPFAGHTFQERRHTVLQDLGTEERERLNRARKLPLRVRRAILRGLSVDPEDRFPSMDALLNELIERRRWPWVSSSLALAAGLGLGALVTSDSRAVPCEGPQAALESTCGPQARRDPVAAMANAGHPGDAEQLEHVARALDRYADEWRRTHSEAHQATNVECVPPDAVPDQTHALFGRHRDRQLLAQEVLHGAEPAPAIAQPRVGSSL